MTLNKTFLLIAVICYVLAALSVTVGGFASLPLVAVGLAFHAGSNLV